VPESLVPESSLNGFNLNGRLCEIVEVLVDRGVTLAQARREFERKFIVASLRQHDGNLGRSARSLGIHRNTLRNKVANLGISSEELRRSGRRASGR
jgi:DNA-binding NtrC family response regulator